MCSWNAGTFTRATGTTGWQDDAAASIGITASRHDTQENELATGINQCINKDGSNAYTAAAAFGGFRGTNLGAATSVTDAARADQVQNGSYIYGGTSGGAANVQTLTLAPVPSAYAAGQIFTFIAGFSNTGALTLNVNGLGAKNVYHGQVAVALIGGEVRVGQLIMVQYDGTQFRLISPNSSVINRLSATTTASNTVAETTLYTFSVPANTITAFKALRLTIIGDTYNVTGGAVTFQWKIKFGAKTILDSGAYSGPSGINRGMFKIDTYIEGVGAAVQRGFSNLYLTSITNDVGSPSVTTFSPFAGYRDMDIDSTISNNIVMTGQMGTASASAEFRTLAGVLELL